VSEKWYPKKKKKSIQYNFALFQICKKIMSLVYAENSDEMGCALHVCDYLLLDVLEHQDLCGYACMRVYVHK
jgi:hypothetical protein